MSETGAGRWKYRALVRPALFALYFALIAAGQFDRLSDFGVMHFSLVALILVLIILDIVELASPDRDHRLRLFTLGLWIMVATRCAIQASGGLDSPLYPLSYLMFAALAAALRPGYTVTLGLAYLAIEPAWIALGGEGSFTDSAVHAAYLAGFGGSIAVFFHLERRGRQQAEQVLDHLTRDVHEFQKDDTVFKLSGLSESGRRQLAVRSALALDDAFRQALETARELLAADSAALYFRSAEGEDFRLREIAADLEEIDLERPVRPGEGLVGFVAEHVKPIRAEGEKRVAGNVPYYRSGVIARHLMAVPLVYDNSAQGILVLDRLTDKPFTAGDEKLASALAFQVVAIHDHALLMKRTEAEASQWKALAELSHRLSGTLDLDHVLDSVMRTGQILSGFSAACVVLPSENPGAPTVVRAVGEVDPKISGKVAPAEGTLAAWVMAEKKELAIQDLASRPRKTPVLGPKLDPPGMKSVLIEPLALKQFPTGALVFFSALDQAFPAKVTKATAILADLATVSIRNAYLFREMEKKAVTDGLTGLFNHRHFQERLADELERAERLGNRVAVALLDIDHFKRVNDTYGHPVGDEVLKAISQVIKRSIRKVDTAARYGGEEFVMVLVGTDHAGARDFAERIREKISRLLFNADKREFKVSLSIGVSIFPDDAAQKKDLIELADQALYRAKQSGRNRTVLASQIRKIMK